MIDAAKIAVAELAIITDAAQKILYASDSFTLNTGYLSEDVLGKTCRFLQGPGSSQSTIRDMNQVLASGGIFEGEILNYRKNGSAFWSDLKVTPLRLGVDHAITHYVSVQRDVSNRVALVNQLHHQALRDHLTGLPNRSATEQAVTKVLRRPKSGTSDLLIGLIDLDDFRRINNIYGHAAGDAVLRQWSDRMRNALSSDDFLGRIGGDEFLLILEPDQWLVGSADMVRELDRLHRVVEKPFVIDGQEVVIGMSMGIVSVPRELTSAEMVLHTADRCLYDVKDNRADRSAWWNLGTVRSTPEHPARGLSMHGDASNGHTVGQNGQNGQDSPGTTTWAPGSEFSPAAVFIDLQPVVDLRDGSIHLFEALARLHLPDGRTAHPDQFLPYLTDEDEHVLFTTVLDQALRVLTRWDEDGVRHNISVNVPPVVLQDTATAGIVKALLDAHALAPSRLGLEILESQVMNLDTQRASVEQLVDLGVGLAIDDLGAGHSSLQRLATFPFNALKLDKGLFGNVQDRPLESLSIMATLIQMGRDLDMGVVIEGLEDESLTEAAIVLGASLGQGYFFAKPQSPALSRQWLETFSLTLHQTPIKTLLGALAYHWQFARLSSPHPLDLEHCPLARFIGELGSPDDAPLWHAKQHTDNGIHRASSRHLIDWLSSLIRPRPTPGVREDSAAG
ncbi:EAL domain-containing protein [Arthrobacter sp. Leaf234]|uniref:EAL domain-containing protein n=1 Tax=Arthrobacter sp. Leaf234 TaxID=1736303 RepID=UPI00138F3780|nr:EAL domain-containing protein [Arthrobacter sp. Leaf234]